MGELVSLRECARRLGVQLRSVQVAIQNGRIDVARTDTHGQRTRVFVDIDTVLQQWAQNTDPGKRHRQTRGEIAGTTPPPGAQEPPSGPAGPGQRRPAGQDTKENPSAYQTARGAREVYTAKMVELKYKLQTKALVPAEEVKKIFFDVGKTIQLNMLNIPNRVAAMIAAESDEKKVFDILQTEITIALEALSNGRIDKLTQ